MAGTESYGQANGKHVLYTTQIVTKSAFAVSVFLLVANVRVYVVRDTHMSHLIG